MRLPSVVMSVLVLVGAGLAVVSGGVDPAAAVHEEINETRYREVWIDHDGFHGIKDPSLGCEYDGRKWFAEPTPNCGDYVIPFDLPSLAGLDRAEVFFDLWRARNRSNVQFAINGVDQGAAGAGQNWSRTPVVREIDESALRTGANELVLRQASAYHLHDAAFRLYGLGGSYPDGRGITGISPSPSRGRITVGPDETITLTAEVSGADAVEFIAYYDGYDRDNDGDRLDWQSFTRTNWHPGGTNKDGGPAIGGYGTIGHVGTVHSNGRVVVDGEQVATGAKSGNRWSIDFDTSFVPNGSPLRFKVRALDRDGNGFRVTDAVGGATDTYTLARTGDTVVEYVIDEEFRDVVLHHGNTSPQYNDAETRDLDLDLTDMVSVHLIGNYWEQPGIFVNPIGADDDDCGNTSRRVGQVADDWVTDVQDVTDFVREGRNVICYEHVRGFGEFIENPGPMMVIRRSPDSAPVVDAGGPYDRVVLPDSLALAASVSDDRNPDPDVDWTADDPGVSFSDPEALSPTVSFPGPGTYELTISATDGVNPAVDDSVSVEVVARPVVDAGPNASVELPSANLDGTVSDDDLGSTEWSVVSGPGTVTFGDAGAVDTTATFSEAGTYTLRLTASDDSGLSASDDVVIVAFEPGTDPPPVPVGDEVGYWMGDAGGEVYGFGDGTDPGSVTGRIVAMTTTPDGQGPWVLTSDGVVHATNGATHFGEADTTGFLPGEVVASISVLPGGDGYWVFTDRGRALSFGAAADLEDLVDLGVASNLVGPIVGSAATASGAGALMVAADGGVFAVGDAEFRGSMGGIPLNGPVVGVVPDPDGDGYWLIADDGGIFAFAADFQGSMGGIPLNAPVVGAVAFGDGYLMVAADGGIFNFSDLEFLGSLGGNPPDQPVSAVAGFPI